MPNTNPDQSVPKARQAFAKTSIRRLLADLHDSGAQLHLDPGPPQHIGIEMDNHFFWIPVRITSKAETTGPDDD